MGGAGEGDEKFQCEGERADGFRGFGKIMLILRMDRLEIMNTSDKSVVIPGGIILLVMGIVDGLFIILIIRLVGGMYGIVW